jgi:hypothetical protein
MIAVLIIGGCSNNNDQVVEQEIEQEIIEPVEEEELNEAPSSSVFPFTGLEAVGEEVDNRVIGVTINNHPAARPQSGLSDADIVYEILSEFEVTRLVALFHSKMPERVGPVRSARPYHIDLVNGYKGVLVHHGWSPEAKVKIESGEIDSLNGLFYDGTLFKRSTDRKAPHNSYITADSIIEELTSLNYALEAEASPLSFYEEDNRNIVGVESNEIAINYYNLNHVHYEFDEVSGLYHRYNKDRQTIDFETEKAIELANLFVIETDHTVLHDDGRRAIDLTSGGRAVLFQDGLAIDVNWENRDGQIIPVKDGQQVPLKPGQTWINVVPTSPGLEEMVNY